MYDIQPPHQADIAGMNITIRNPRKNIKTSNYGDIRRVDCTGASEKTAQQDKLKEKGIEASSTMARTDLSRMQKYKSVIMKVAREKAIDPAVIAAIISRECRAGNTLKNGWGDNDNAFGLMQVDKRWHTIQGKWDSEEHIKQGAGILIDMIGSIQKQFPSWTAEQRLKGGIAAYNCGPSRIQSYENVDNSTTGHDYSNDVLARAQWYKKNGF
ncbi:lysozyme g-like isoform X3 [Ascaphus truei]|uniref:lysozyme g-like isoform X3 n=1 Tax=Ascaphus truei TaxID=8439 RepID=UPI003F5A8EBB